MSQKRRGVATVTRNVHARACVCVCGAIDRVSGGRWG